MTESWVKYTDVLTPQRNRILPKDKRETMSENLKIHVFS